jgi:TPR repeat protein
MTRTIQLDGQTVKVFPRDRRFAAILKRVARNASRGVAEAQQQMGFYYELGEGVPRDEKLAMTWYLRAAAAGYEPAWASVAGAYQNGIGVEQDPLFSARILEAASRRGDGAVLRSLGKCYQSGIGVKRDLPRALALYKRALASGFSSVTWDMATLALARKQYTQAARWFRASAEKNDNPEAARELGVLYQKGLGVRRSPSRAFYWMRRAASARDFEAEERLADYYEGGFGTERSVKLALEWYWRSAQRRSPTSAYKIAKLLIREGRDRSEQVRWLKLAAEWGHGGAAGELRRLSGR